MTFIHIKKQKIQRAEGPVEVFAVPAVAIATAQGKKLIPNPAGKEACVFSTLEDAESAVRRAGFDYVFEGRKTYLNQPPAHKSQPVIGPVSLLDAIPILLDRLRDKEAAVIANAAFALGELHAPEAVAPLVDILGHEDPNVRRQVAEALAKIGDPALAALKQAFNEARKSQENNAKHVRLTVITAYLEMTFAHRELLGEILPQVIEALTDESWLVRSQAALVIGQSAQHLKPEGQ